MKTISLLLISYFFSLVNLYNIISVDKTITYVDNRINSKISSSISEVVEFQEDDPDNYNYEYKIPYLENAHNNAIRSIYSNW